MPTRFSVKLHSVKLHSVENSNDRNLGFVSFADNLWIMNFYITTSDRSEFSLNFCDFLDLLENFKKIEKITKTSRNSRVIGPERPIILIQIHNPKKIHTQPEK